MYEWLIYSDVQGDEPEGVEKMPTNVKVSVMRKDMQVWQMCIV